MFAESILTESELKDLLRIISNQNKPVQDLLSEASEKFPSKEFLLCKALASLLTSSLLNRSQRVAALVILIKSNIQKLNPFFGVLDYIYQQKELVVESNLVVSLLCDFNAPADVSRKTVKELIEYYNRQNLFQETPQYYQSQLREPFARASEEIKKTSTFSNDLSNVMLDSSASQTKAVFPADPLRFEDLVEQDLQSSGFRPRFLTVIPQELPIGDIEVEWLYPMVTDALTLIHGVEPEETEKTMVSLVKKAASGQLTPREKSLLSELIADRVDLLAKDDLLIDNFFGLLQNRHETLVSNALLLLHNQNNELYRKCLEMLMENNLDCELSVIGVVNLLVKIFELPQSFLDGFIAAWFKSLSKFKENQTFTRKLHMILMFMKHVLEKKLFDPKPKLELWKQYLAPHTDDQQAAEVLKAVQKTDNQ